MRKLKQETYEMSSQENQLLLFSFTKSEKQTRHEMEHDKNGKISNGSRQLSRTKTAS